MRELDLERKSADVKPRPCTRLLRWAQVVNHDDSAGRGRGIALDLQAGAQGALGVSKGNSSNK